MVVAVLIIQCLVLLLLFLLYGNQIYKNNPQEKEQAQIPNKELDIFRQGARQNWLTVNVCLYKMWTELEILDYDNISSKLQETLEELTSDQNKLEEWASKFNIYIKDTKE